MIITKEIFSVNDTSLSHFARQDIESLNKKKPRIAASLDYKYHCRFFISLLQANPSDSESLTQLVFLSIH